MPVASSTYWPFFCEENVWHLAGNIASDVEEAWVVIISNRALQVAIWSQTAAKASTEPVVWDYHVILLELAAKGWRATDPDSSLETPIDAGEYLAASFRALGEESAQFRPMFRILAADQYRAVLRSDRSHMRDPSGEWLAPPPPRPPIGVSVGGGSNLMRLVDMERPFAGDVCDLAGLLARMELG